MVRKGYDLREPSEMTRTWICWLCLMLASVPACRRDSAEGCRVFMRSVNPHLRIIEGGVIPKAPHKELTADQMHRLGRQYMALADTVRALRAEEPLPAELLLSYESVARRASRLANRVEEFLAADEIDRALTVQGEFRQVMQAESRLVERINDHCQVAAGSSQQR